jgi:uncharacterized integral membrane protein
MRLRTWMLEQITVAVILLITLIISLIPVDPLTLHYFAVQFLTALAVFLTFCHTTVTDRLSEKQSHMKTPDVECYKWEKRWFRSKEMTWIVVFLLSQLWAALVGALIFFLYPVWRKIYRKYRPLNRESRY